MKNIYLFIAIGSYLLTVLLGTLFHFLYDLTNQQFLISLFTPINESIFEHLKLFFYPVIIISFIESLIKKENILEFVSIRGLSASIGCIIIVIFNYIYRLCTDNQNNPIIDISSYYVVVLIIYLISNKLFSIHKESKHFVNFAFLIMITTIFLLTLFTFNKPTLDIFLS